MTRNISEYLRKNKLKTNEILALSSAASVLRKETVFRGISFYLKEKRIRIGHKRSKHFGMKIFEKFSKQKRLFKKSFKQP